jgi:hypothetical protein
MSRALVLKLTISFLAFCLTKQSKAQKANLQLTCPLADAEITPPSKNSIQWNEPDMCIVIKSKPDTLAKACHDGKVSNVQMNDEGTYDIVFYYQNYYFWYTGVTKPLVRRNDVVKAGQPLGVLPSTGQLELLMFEFETPLDPMKYLNCKKD